MSGRAASIVGKLRLLLLFSLVMLVLWWAAPPIAYTLATPGSGPGGVGTTNGSSTLELWLRADRGVFVNDDCTSVAGNTNTAGCWQDQSGNSADAAQSNSANQPIYITNSINGQPVLAFNGSKVLSSGPVTLGDLSVFAVFNATVSDQGGIVYEHNDRTSGGPGSNLFTSAICTITVNRSGLETTKSLTFGWAENDETRIVTQAYNGTHDGHTLSINNFPQTLTDCSLTDDPLSDPLPLPTSVYIGAQANVSYALVGNIAELIFFSEDLPAVQKILVENYLSAKYNIAFDLASTNDHYDGDTLANGDFDLDVAGIGRFGSESHAIAQAAGMVVSDTTFLKNNGDWLLFGHNIPQNTNTSDDVPTGGDWGGSDDQRWSRSWYIDVTDVITSGGTIALSFDFSDAGMSGAPGGTTTNYRLLSRPNPTGTFSDITGTCTGGASVSGDRVTFSSVDVSCLGSNFTLGTLDRDDSPTAVTLQPITATTPGNGLVVLAACVLTLGLGSLWTCLRHRPE